MNREELPGRLRIEGPRIIKPNGYEIILRGPCMGSWGEDDPVDMAQIKAMGANSVRIGMRWWGIWGNHPETNSRDDDGFAFLKRENVQHWFDLITSASAAGLWVIPFIDSNCGQSGTQDEETKAFCDKKKMFGAQGRNFFTDPGMRRVFAYIVWPAIAAKLRTIARIALLELQPECAGQRGPEYAEPVRNFYREVIDGVRSVDAETPFLIGARDNYNIDLCDEAYLPERQDVAYTGNQLSWRVVNPDKFDAGMVALTNMRAARNVPVYIQQLGRKTGDDPTLEYMRDALYKANAARVGFAWWQWKQNTGDPNEYALNYKNAVSGGWIAKEDEIAALSEALTA
jgi:hypothetical protein